MGWIKEFFCGPKYFDFDNKKEYTITELMCILNREDLTLGTGNAIVRLILEALVKKHIQEAKNEK